MKKARTENQQLFDGIFDGIIDVTLFDGVEGLDYSNKENKKTHALIGLSQLKN